MTKFQQYLESSGKLRKKNSLKSKLMYIIWFSSFEKHIKELILTTLDKKIEENPQK